MLTKEALGIFFLITDKDGNKGHEDVDGFSVFGIWKGQSPPEFLDQYVATWHPFQVGVTSFVYSYEDVEILLFDTWIKEWPSDDKWKSCLEKVFLSLIDNGAEIAWCGGETCFDTEYINGDVYACFTREYGLMCNSTPCEEVKFLSEAQIIVAGKVVTARGVLIPDVSPAVRQRTSARSS